jgi:hypothetical protein
MGPRAVLDAVKKNLLFLPGIESWFLVRPAHSLVTILTAIPAPSGLLPVFCKYTFEYNEQIFEMEYMTSWNVTSSPQLTSRHVAAYPNYGTVAASFLNCQPVRNVGRSQGGVTSLSSQVQGHMFVGHLNAGGLENTLRPVTQFTLMAEETYGPRRKNSSQHKRENNP